MIVGIHHVALVSSDLARSLPHYTALLGMRVVEQSSSGAGDAGEIATRGAGFDAGAGEA